MMLFLDAQQLAKRILEFWALSKTYVFQENESIEAHRYDNHPAGLDTSCCMIPARGWQPPPL